MAPLVPNGSRRKERAESETLVAACLDSEIVRLRLSGHTYQQIADRVGVCLTTAWKISKKHGAPSSLWTRYHYRKFSYAIAVAARIQLRLESGETSYAHGAIRYRARGCRCDICREGNRLYQRSYQASRALRGPRRQSRKPLPDRFRAREFAHRVRAEAAGCESEEVDFWLIWLRDEGICHLCGSSVEPDDLDFDHVVPIALGGAHNAGNVKISHYGCNRSKGARKSPRC